MSEDINKIKMNDQETRNFIKEILSQLDYTLTTYKERKKLVTDIHEKYGIAINERYSYYFNANQDKYMNRVCFQQINHLLECLSDYVLSAKTENEDLPSKPKFYKSSSLKEKGRKKESISLDDVVKTMTNEDSSLFTYYDDNSSGKYILGELQKHMDNCPYIDDYIAYNQVVRQIIRDKKIRNVKIVNGKKVFIYKNSNGNPIKEEIKHFSEKEIKMLKKTIGYTKYNSMEIDKEIITILKEYYKFVYFNKIRQGTFYPDYDMFDWDDRNQILALLKFRRTGYFDSDLGCLLYDLDELIKQISLTPTELEILDLYRNQDIKQKDIGIILDVSQQYISASLYKIAAKITEGYWNSYEDWYYTNVVKGKYKQCSKCGQNKIASTKYFKKDRKGKNGLKSICKSCNK